MNCLKRALRTKKQETVKRLTPETMSGVMAEIKSGFYKVRRNNSTIID